MVTDFTFKNNSIEATGPVVTPPRRAETQEQAGAVTGLQRASMNPRDLSPYRPGEEQLVFQKGIPEELRVTLEWNNLSFTI